MIERWIQRSLTKQLTKPFVHIVFGARQTGKSTLSDARHLLTFLAEHPKQARHGFIICRCPRPLRLHDKVTALPWFCL